MKFNENLKYLRKQANLTQERLAEELNVSRQTITKWESGQSMPDIENLKELSYIFSISIDSLVGDIESKSSLRINKKINDIGWFTVPFIIICIFTTISVSEFINYISNNEDLVFFTIIIMAILSVVLYIVSVKKWLNEKQKSIINLTDTIEGKKERRKYLLKKSLITAIDTFFILIIISLPSIDLGTENFLTVTLENIITLVVIDIILYIYNYKKLQKQVKEFNKENNTND